MPDVLACAGCGHEVAIPAEGPSAPWQCPACGRGNPALAASESATLPPSDAGDSPGASEAATLGPPTVGEGPARLPSVPGHEVLAELGRGGMGVVYEARHAALDRPVALKVLLAGGHAGSAELARFRTEAQSIARAQHPNIVQVFEVGEHDGLPYFSMELCPGGSLERKLAGTPLPPRDAAALVEKLARAMHAAHERGVIHRDLKPANVLLTADGTPKVTDFGLARKLGEAGQTATGAVMGTPSYMAPEQAGGKSAEVGPAADIYALGAILYECLTGRPPFKATTPLDTILQVVGDDPVPPTQLQGATPRDLETICLKCLHKEPARRYASAEALAEDLRRFGAGEAIVARPVGRAERVVKWVRRNPALAAALSAVAAAMLLGTAVSTYFAIDASRQADKARANEATAVAAGNDLAEANRALTRTAADLGRATDRLEVTLARSLLRPLALQGGQMPVSDAELEALWELAASPGDRLGYRLVEEALRGPVTTRQLSERAVLALHAAVGLDARRRDAVTALLLKHLDEPGVGQQVQVDLAIALSALDSLSSPAADRMIRLLVAAAENDFLDQRRQMEAVLALASRLGPQDAASVAATLSGAKVSTHVLVKPLSAVAARMGPGDAVRAAATFTAALKSPEGGQMFHPAECLAALAAGMSPREAIAVLSREMADGKNRAILSSVARGMVPVAPRMGPDEAALAATALVKAVNEINFLSSPEGLMEALSAVGPRLGPETAARLAADLAQKMRALAGQTEGGVAIPALLPSLSMMAARLGPGDAAAVANVLTSAIKEAKPFVLPPLARCLSAVVARLGPEDTARAITPAADFLVQSLRATKNWIDGRQLAESLAAVAPHLGPDAAARMSATLDQALGEPKGREQALEYVAQGLAAVATRHRPEEAAAILTQAMLRPNPGTVFLLPGLVAVAPRLGPKGAARAADRLNQAIRGATYPAAVPLLAQALAAVVAQLSPEDATRAVASAREVLTQRVRENPNTTWAFEATRALSGLAAFGPASHPGPAGPAATAKAAADLSPAMEQELTKAQSADARRLIELAQAHSALIAAMSPEDAAAASTAVIDVVARAMAKFRAPHLPGFPQPAVNTTTMAQALAILLSTARVPERSARAAGAVSAEAGHPLAALPFLVPAAEPLPCPLSAQQLVDLLKWPTCVGEARRVVLDRLGDRYRRHFPDRWDFVRFAGEQGLGLDFITPPRRPESPASAKP